MSRSWSSMRKQLERESICDSLKGRIQYFATTYRKCPDQKGRVAVRLDGQEVFNSSYFCWCKTRHEVILDFPKPKEASDDYWDKVYIETENRGGFSQFSFYEAFFYYQNHSVDACLTSDNAVVRLFTILDKRVGKRRLQKLLPELEQQPYWLKFFYVLRMEAEGITQKI